MTDNFEYISLVFAEPPDLLITDIGPPNVGGSPLIRWLKAKRPDAKIVAITEIGEMALASRAHPFVWARTADQILT